MSLVKQGVKAAGRGLREVLPELFENTTKVGKELAATIRPRDVAGISYQKTHNLPEFLNFQQALNSGDVATMARIADDGNSKANAANIKARSFKNTYSRTQKGQIKVEDIGQQREIGEAWGKVDKAKERGSGHIDNYVRGVRSVQGTPTQFTEDQVKNFIQTNHDPRIQARTGIRKAYGKRIGEKAYEKGEFPRHLGEQIPKPVNARLKALEGLTATVEGHHLISNLDSGIIGYQLDKLKDPIAKASVYDYLLNKYKIVPGDFDLNLANLPTGVHRLKDGGDLHTWLDRMGFEDYWKEWAKAHPGDITETEILDAIDLYFDEVFHPMILKVKKLLKDNPTKADFEGEYFPEYLVDEAQARLKELNQRYAPEERFPKDSAAYDRALDEKMEMAYQSGAGDESRYWEHAEGQPIFSRSGYGDPSVKKQSPKKRTKKR